VSGEKEPGEGAAALRAAPSDNSLAGAGPPRLEYPENASARGKAKSVREGGSPPLPSSLAINNCPAVEAFAQGATAQQYPFPPPAQDRAVKEFLDRIEFIVGDDLALATRRSLYKELRQRAEFLHIEFLETGTTAVIRREAVARVVALVRAAEDAVGVARQTLKELWLEAPDAYQTLFGADDNEGAQIAASLLGGAPSGKPLLVDACDSMVADLGVMHSQLASALQRVASSGYYGRAAASAAGGRVPRAGQRLGREAGGRQPDRWKQTATLDVAVWLREVGAGDKVVPNSRELHRLVNIFATRVAGVPEIGRDAVSSAINLLIEAEAEDRRSATGRETSKS
jgi:hypothetical protein